jgi:Putative auto-transporter adhesin, head GIN domain
MRHSYALFAALIPLAALGAALPVAAQTTIRLAPFKAVTLHSGGTVTLRYAPSQRVTLLKGSTDYSRVTVAEGGRLVIDRVEGKRPKGPKGYELEIEILTPELTEVVVSDGGTIRSQGSFPAQAALAVAVRNGGRIDLRSMTVDAVSAAVEEGGRIFITPQSILTATIAGGGGITYWGHPRVTSSVEHGGVVARGTAADLDQPLEDCSPAVPATPALPPTRMRGTF